MILFFMRIFLVVAVEGLIGESGIGICFLFIS